MRLIVWPKIGGEVWARPRSLLEAIAEARDAANLKNVTYSVAVEFRLPLVGTWCTRIVDVEPGAFAVAFQKNGSRR